MKKTDMKMIGLVAAGVLVAGWLMNVAGDQPVIEDAARGYGA